MVWLRQFASLIPILAALAVGANHLSDDQVMDYLKQKDSTLKPLTLTRRDAAGIKTRHLRPFTPTVTKREITLPDVGQSSTFSGVPEPIRGEAGYHLGSGDTNTDIDKENPDYIAAPTTDNGVIPNLKWSFSLSHTRLLKGGWIREQVITDLPSSKEFSAAELRLAPNAYRELHWHRVAEWGYILNGTGRVSTVDKDGRNYISDIKGPKGDAEGDIYYFPQGIAHSIQALDEGLEIIIIFTDPDFDRTGTTFMLADWLTHTPLEVVAKNFGLNISQLAGLPQKDPYIFPSTVKPPQLGHASEQAIKSPVGTMKNPLVFDLSKQPKSATAPGGGYMKIQDSVTNFPASVNVASAYVHIEPLGLRELHWHNEEEWIYVISGKGRATAFAGNSAARTFDLQSGDTAVFPVAYGHYIENLSSKEPFIFIEVFKSTQFTDFSATQWLALTPSIIVAELLNISVETVQGLKKDKQYLL